ncbi:uncharacterized protein BCR38DRAFT_484619 [Pseudomassariella vexata]|uniref:Extracellular membrane protein CFEM domain-containing protein n=1 Tax=Pseudomassariella vexata TaxID=1141098 RepID=A0A1Y2E101_9PEZI|nr:uncharacterized protein BCR38DRAFT_484619 [Pseudomassariella vexata]ORY65157.1 hypothetical protein BCR38DRAFT_484619 [Pseudomassariella vexata]
MQFSIIVAITLGAFAVASPVAPRDLSSCIADVTTTLNSCVSRCGTDSNCTRECDTNGTNAIQRCISDNPSG